VKAKGAGGQPAYLLHRHDWSETSLVVQLFTREQGRVVAVAKGAKRPYSQLRPVLLPFQRLQVAFTRVAADSTAEVLTLKTADWGGSAPLPPGAVLFSGFYLNELLLKLLARQDAHPRLFDAYEQTLAALPAGGDAAEAALRAFELTLLRETGLLPDLAGDTATQQPLRPQASYRLRPELGVVEAHDDTEPALPGQALVGLEAALQHGSVAALQAACRPVLSALRSQLRGLVHYHVGPGPLKSRQVLLDAQRLLDRPAIPRA
jgi:DNA repair protein RecO (recombination protein O)